jgi:hypothetical protein
LGERQGEETSSRETLLPQNKLPSIDTSTGDMDRKSQDQLVLMSLPTSTEETGPTQAGVKDSPQIDLAAPEHTLLPIRATTSGEPFAETKQDQDTPDPGEAQLPLTEKGSKPKIFYSISGT